MTTADQFRAALNDAMDIVVLTDDRAKELVAPILKQILALRDQDVPEATVDGLLDALRRCCEFNAAVSLKAQHLSNLLDELARTHGMPFVWYPANGQRILHEETAEAEAAAGQQREMTEFQRGYAQGRYIRRRDTTA